MSRWTAATTRSALGALVIAAAWTMGCSGCTEPDPEPPTPDPEDMRPGSPEEMGPAQDRDAGVDMRAEPPDDDMGPDDPEDMSPADMPPVTGCAPGSPEGAPETFELNGWELTLRGGVGAWELVGPGGQLRGAPGCQEREAGPVSGVRVGLGEASVRSAFGNWRIRLRGLDWQELTGQGAQVEARGEGAALVWPLRGSEHTVSLVFAPEGDEDLRVQLETTHPEATGGELQLECGPDESFFGLGTQVTGMDLRGGTYPMWTQEQGIDKPEGGGLFPIQNDPEAAYAPMGVLHSSAGWSGLVTHDAYSEFDLCEGDAERVVMRSYRDQPGLVLVGGPTPRERMTRITEYVGRITTPPDWVFGPWNDTVGGPERVAEVTGVLRDNDVPSSAIWVEDWIGGQLTANGFRLSYAWEWDPMTYPDLPQDIEALHARGFAFLGYFNTFVPDTNRMWDEGVEGGYLIEDEDGEVYTFRDPAFRTASLIDFTDPQAREWLAGYLEVAARDVGLDGWMADFSEWLPHDAVLNSGVDAWRYHNRYPLAWQELNREVFERVHAQDPQEADNNWVFWARSGWASVHGGSAGLTPTMWGGDQNTDWGYDDGLPTVAPIGAHVGMAGVAIFGSDIAGYSWIGENDPLSTKELFLRWSAMGALHPLMRTHQGSAKCLNWSFERDAQTLAHYRRWASIHALLLPYFRARAEEARQLGWPITRHPYLVFPDQPALWTGPDYQYFLGDELLVAPVMRQGAQARPVQLPGPGWWPLLGDAPREQGGEVMAQASPTELPVFVRPGTILGLLGQVVDSFYGADAPGVTDLSDVEGSWRLGLYPRADGGLDGLELGGAQISGQGWVELGELDWSSATLDGQALMPCPMAGPQPSSCVAEDHALLVAEDATLRVGGAELSIDGTQEQRWRVYLAGAAFGEHQASTGPVDLDSDAPPVCMNPKGDE